jgi:beta-glucanase (GH16 family)
MLAVLEVTEEDAVAQSPEKKASAPADRRPTKIWTRKGPLGETPKRVTDALPLSDQQNKAGWVKYEPMSDEFEGNALNRDKWTIGGEVWRGRPPALFSDKNVTVSDGKLHLTMRKEKLPDEKDKNFHDYTSASLYTTGRSGYGYYEVLAKPMNSAGSSAFWFQREGLPDWTTEIDVFEISGNGKNGLDRRYFMTLHVFRTPTSTEHFQVGDFWDAPWRLADAYHVYGLEWDKDELKFFVDGVLVRSVENTHWHRPLRMIFDSETMPDWFGMPEDKDLPSTFSVEYVRAWKKKP